MTRATPTAAHRKPSLWLWVGILLVCCGLLVDLWNFRQSARARVPLDTLQSALTQQKFALDVQHNALDAQLSVITRQTCDTMALAVRARQLANRHAPADELTQINGRVQAANLVDQQSLEEVGAPVASYAAASKRYQAAALPLVAASESFVKSTRTRMYFNLTIEGVLIGGALAAVGLSLRWSTAILAFKSIVRPPNDCGV